MAQRTVPTPVPVPVEALPASVLGRADDDHLRVTAALAALRERSA